MQLSRISYVLYFLSVISTITLSGSVLMILNYPYGDPSGSAIYKVHPTLYLCFLSIMFTILEKRNLAIKRMFLEKNLFPLYLIFIFSILYVFIFLKQPLAPIAVTWLCPVFFISLYFQCSDIQKYRIYYACLIIIIINSIMGIYEYVVGQHVVPQYYFSLSDGEMIDLKDWAFYRAEALYGHPLAATMFSSLTIIALVVKSKWNNLTGLEKVCLTLTVFSLPAFGGRFPIAICFLILSVYFLVNITTFFKNGVTKRTFILVCFVLYLVPFILYMAFELGLFDKLIERIADDNGSAATRLVAFNLLLDTPFSNLIFGDYDKSLFIRQVNSGTIYGIEVSWIAMLLIYGLVVNFSLYIYIYNFFKIVMDNINKDFIYLVFGYLLMLTSGTGLSSKSLSLSQFILVSFFITFSKYNGSNYIYNSNIKKTS